MTRIGKCGHCGTGPWTEGGFAPCDDSFCTFPYFEVSVEPALEIFDAGTPEDVMREADRIFDRANLNDCIKDAKSQFPILGAIARAIMRERNK